MNKEVPTQPQQPQIALVVSPATLKFGQQQTAKGESGWTVNGYFISVFLVLLYGIFCVLPQFGNLCISWYFCVWYDIRLNLDSISNSYGHRRFSKKLKA